MYSDRVAKSKWVFNIGCLKRREIVRPRQTETSGAWQTKSGAESLEGIATGLRPFENCLQNPRVWDIGPECRETIAKEEVVMASKACCSQESLESQLGKVRRKSYKRMCHQ